MAFGYTTVTISGVLPTVDVPIEFMRFAKDYLTGTLGWTLTEDRSTQAGANSKIILHSNGEDNTASTFYLVLSSGTDGVDIQAATFWNTSTHTVGSGVATPTTQTSATIPATQAKITKYWISGDKDAVTFIGRRSGNYFGSHVGRIRSLYPASADPFPIYVVGAGNSFGVDTLSSTNSSASSFLDATSALIGGECDWEPIIGVGETLGSDQTPDNVFGSMERFTCFPLIVGISDNSPVRRSVRGFSTNIWVTMGPGSSSMDAEDVFRAADGKTYQVFFGSTTAQRAVVIRRS